MAEPQAFSGHGGCTRHRHYRLTCDQFDGLLAECADTCQICSTPGPESSHGMLHIDHDPHFGQWAVRGMLCGRCNTSLGMTGEGWIQARAYIANPWWKRQCAALGLPAGRSPEPPLGSAIRNQFGIVWIRRDEAPDSWWEMPCQRGLHITGMTWKRLYRSYGAHNLVPFDLGAIFDDDPDGRGEHWHLRYEIRGPYWAAAMKALGR